MPMHRKLHYISKRNKLVNISKCNKLVKLVAQVQYHVNVIYSLKGEHTHQRCRQKQFQETRRALVKGWCMPGSKTALRTENQIQ